MATLIPADQPISNPTYYQNILAMFSQYDMIMMSNYFDLHNYNDIKTWAPKIYLALQPSSDPNKAAVGWSQLDQVHVMPEVPGAWPASWVQTFKNWMDAGCPEGTPPPSPAFSAVAPQQLNDFIALSAALTGITDLGTRPNQQQLATIYYNRMMKRPPNTNAPGGINDTLAGVLAAWTANPDVDTIAKKYPICSDIIIIWYNATTNWDNNGNPLPPGPPYYGTPSFNQYKESLVWKVALCHPMGYAPELSPFYWQSAPTPDGLFTGLFDKNY